MTLFHNHIIIMTTYSKISISRLGIISRLNLAYFDQEMLAIFMIAKTSLFFNPGT